MPIDALLDYGARYEGDPAAPMLAIVLDGLGDPALDAQEIFLLPAPLAVIVAPAGEAAVDHVIGARDAGYEALLSVDAAALAADAGLSVIADGAPIIGVATEGEVTDTTAIAAMIEALAARGMGLLDVTADGGAASYRIAASTGLPAAPGGRRIDDAPTSAAVYQSLERAAFDARRLGAFVVVARPTPTVLAGLRRWLNVKAGKSVDVAPLSAVMRKLNG